MLPICKNCGKKIKGLAYKYNSIANVNGKLVKGNDLLICSKKCCMKYDSIAEKEIGTGFMCLRDSIYLESPIELPKMKPSKIINMYHNEMKDNIRLKKLKQKSKFIKDVMEPIEEVFDAIEKAVKDYNDHNSDFNKINRGEKINESKKMDR